MAVMMTTMAMPMTKTKKGNDACRQQNENS